MLNSNTHPTLAEAYLEGLQDLLQHGQNVGSVKDSSSTASGFGVGDRPAIELLGYSFQISNPYSSLFLSAERVVRVPYCIGLLLWSIAASNNVDWLSFYNPLARQYSDDTATLCGAFGKRLFNYQDEINQIEAICVRLANDPNSRRTVAAICTPEDNVRVSREYPCCIGVQYFLRDGVLHATTYMRAQSALVVLPYDAFLFMSLQCFIAAKIGAKVGIYKHVVGTYHIYESEKEQAERVLQKGAIPITVGEMPSSERTWQLLLNFEEQLRTAVIANDVNKVRTLNENYSETASFLDQAKSILMLHAVLKLNISDSVNELLSVLPTPLKELLRAYIATAK
jgi:thymidylate synthase